MGGERWPVLDDLERGLFAASEQEDARLEEGVRLVHRSLASLLERQGVQPIETDGRFDPHVHEALLSQPSDAEEGSVIDVVQKGYKLGELLAAAELDMRWHSLPAMAPRENVDQFETTALKLTHTDFPDVPPRYRSSYFLHIWANNYAAGYYAYLWTEMLDDDAFHWITEHGGLTRANGQRFRELILSRGHSEDYGPMFRAFYGRAPDVGPMLEHRGLAPSGG